MTREHVEALGKRSPAKHSTMIGLSNPIGGIVLRPVMKASTSPQDDQRSSLGEVKSVK